MLLIRRTVSPRDRWSGDLALPGGRVDPGEALLEAAIREVYEEVGLNMCDQKQFALIGQGDTLPVFERRAKRTPWREGDDSDNVVKGDHDSDDNDSDSASDGSLDWVYRRLVISYFLFVERVTTGSPVPLRLSRNEVAAAAWVDLRQIAEPGRALVPIHYNVPQFPQLAGWRARSFDAVSRWAGLHELFFPGIMLLPAASTHALPSPLAWLEAIDVCSRYPRIAGPANAFKHEQWVLWGLTLTVCLEMLVEAGLDRSSVLPPRSMVFSRSPMTDWLVTTMFPSRFPSHFPRPKL